MGCEGLFCVTKNIKEKRGRALLLPCDDFPAASPSSCLLPFLTSNAPLDLRSDLRSKERIEREEKRRRKVLLYLLGGLG